MALSTSGDGSADQQAAHRLSLSPFTINAHRKTIMGKLGLRLKKLCATLSKKAAHL